LHCDLHVILSFYFHNAEFFIPIGVNYFPFFYPFTSREGTDLRNILLLNCYSKLSSFNRESPSLIRSEHFIGLVFGGIFSYNKCQRCWLLFFKTLLDYWKMSKKWNFEEKNVARIAFHRFNEIAITSQIFSILANNIQILPMRSFKKQEHQDKNHFMLLNVSSIFGVISFNVLNFVICLFRNVLNFFSAIFCKIRFLFFRGYTLKYSSFCY